MKKKAIINMSDVIPLRLADGMEMQVGRCGYPDEGIRLTFFRHCPFKFHTEVQLSKRDTEDLISLLQQNLEYHKDMQLPE